MNSKKILILAALCVYGIQASLTKKVMDVFSEVELEVAELIKSACQVSSAPKLTLEQYDDFLIKIAKINRPTIERFTRSCIIGCVIGQPEYLVSTAESLAGMIDVFYDAVANKHDLADSRSSRGEIKLAIKEARRLGVENTELLAMALLYVYNAFERMRLFFAKLMKGSDRTIFSMLTTTEQIIVLIVMNQFLSVPKIKTAYQWLLSFVGTAPGKVVGNELGFAEYFDMHSENFWQKPKKEAFAMAMAAGADYDDSLAFCELYIAQEAPLPVLEYAMIMAIEKEREFGSKNKRAKTAAIAICCKQPQQQHCGDRQ